MHGPRLELLHEAPVSDKGVRQTLLFVHGAFGNAGCWQRHFMPWFARRGFDCWAVSLEGHGNSEGRQYLSAISIDDYVKNLIAVIHKLKRPPILVGHSMGGYVIRQYLNHHVPHGAVFLASVPPLGLAASTLRMLTQTPSMLMQLNLYQGGHFEPEFIELKKMLFSADAAEEDVDYLIAASQPESQRALMDMTLVNPLDMRIPHKVPSLVLGAANDTLISPDDIVSLADQLDVSAEILPHMGHMMMLDTRWEQVAQRIYDWIDTHYG